MLSGLILASIALATAPTALFQRKARAGWLEELDDIREEALESPEAGVGSVGAPADIWNDTEAGGPHSVETDPAMVEADQSSHAGIPPKASGPLWAQPAPHPVRPEEMWHPAATVPEPLDGGEDLGIDEPEPEAVDASPPVREAEALGFDALFNPTRRASKRVALGEVATFEDLLDERSPLPDTGLAPAAPPRPSTVAAVATEVVEGAPDPNSAGATSAPQALVVGADGGVVTAGAIVRLAGGHGGVVRAGDEVTVSLGIADPDGDDGAAGWCWVAPAEGQAVDVRVQLRAAVIMVGPGATALTVAEADGSSFVMVIDGEAILDRSGDVTNVGPSSVAMIDREGVVQVDRAERDEIEADPIVAENRALDSAS